MAKYIAYVILAIFVLAIAWWSKENPNYYNEAQSWTPSTSIDDTSAYEDLPNPMDREQIEQYVQQKYMEGVASREISTSEKSPLSFESLPDLNDEGAIEKYVIQKFHEGQGK
ncbi:hypothetical protein L0244_14865 [bacterium]|nr:hypothetical protein [bacterium]